MTPEQALAQTEKGELRPIYLVMGEESWLVSRVYRALRAAVVSGPAAAFNEDRFHAGEVAAEAVVAAARTVPMMAPRRFVSVLGVERWEARGATTPLDALADYAANPVPSTVLVLCAEKLNAQRRLVTAAKKGGFLVECAPMHRRDRPAFVRKEAQARGHAIAQDVAELLAEIGGADLGPLVDAVERLSLYVGPAAPIDERAVENVVARVRQGTVWQLIDALGRTDVAAALAAFDEAYDAREGGVRLLGAVAWGVRQLAKFDAARRSGASPDEAVRAAGGTSYKAQEYDRTVKRLGLGRLGRWLELLAEADNELKGSRRNDRAVLETMIVEMCRGPGAAGPPLRRVRH